MSKVLLGAVLTFWLAEALAGLAWAAEPKAPPGAGRRRIVIYDEARTEVDPVTAVSDDLWLSPADLRRASGFVVKPEGVCRDEMCVPLPRARRREFLERRGRTEWFNLSAFARLMRQPAAHDAGLGVWYFGPRPVQQNARLASFEAPDFELPDLQGRLHRLSDHRGKKVLLVTWASW